MKESRPEAGDTPDGLARRLGHLLARAEQSRPVQGLLHFYERHEKLTLAAFFLGGVLYDAATLSRIDSWFDNVFLFAYLLLLGSLIVVATLAKNDCLRRETLLRYRTWYPLLIQFLMGALFSAYVVYYSQSVSLTGTLLFLVVLVGLLVANELIRWRVANLYLLLALYFLATFSFFTFFIPVVTKEMDYRTFVMGGALSAGVVGLIVLYLAWRGVFDRWRQFLCAAGLVACLFGLMNLLYVQNIIPPVPLAMRYGGVFHHVHQEGNAYVLRFEKPEWYQVWINSDERFHYHPGDTVYCFVAIFAPTDLKKKIYHEWSYYDAEQEEWIATDRISYEVVGLHNRGYRGYTFKENVHPGQWRVDVETSSGRIIGRIPFEIERSSGPVPDLVQTRYE